MINAKLLDNMNNLGIDTSCNYFDFGSYVGLLGQKDQGIELLELAVTKFKESVKGKTIPKPVSTVQGLFNLGENYELLRQYQRLRSSEQGILYLKENEPLIKLSLDQILEINDDSIIFDIISKMGWRIISPLARKKEIEEVGYTETVHPNFIRAVAEYKEPLFASDTRAIKIFYENHPLPKRLIRKANRVANLYYKKNKEKKLRLWKKMEIKWSEVCLETYKHFLEGFVKPSILGELN